MLDFIVYDKLKIKNILLKSFLFVDVFIDHSEYYFDYFLYTLYNITLHYKCK